MAGRRRSTPLVLSSAAALIGVAVFAIVLRATTPEDLAPDRSRPVADALQPNPQRFAFALKGAFDLMDDEPSLRPALAPEPPGASGWSTEVNAETAAEAAPPSLPGWRSALSRTFRLPSMSEAPKPPPRHYTLKARLAEIGPAAIARVAAKFDAAKAAWPPADVALVAIKDTRSLELHARAAGGAWTLVHAYRIQAASGGAGPKLRQGDKQVPEGVYGIAFLNPNSAYHLSLRVNYPNAFDRQMASKDGRKDLGGDIMIHGKNLSAGCLAMGDEAVEELFALAAQVGLANVRVVIAPTDFRQAEAPAKLTDAPPWLPKLYADIAVAMADFKPPPRRPTGLLSLFMQ